MRSTLALVASLNRLPNSSHTPYPSSQPAPDRLTGFQAWEPKEAHGEFKRRPGPGESVGPSTSREAQSPLLLDSHLLAGRSVVIVDRRSKRDYIYHLLSGSSSVLFKYCKIFSYLLL